MATFISKRKGMSFYRITEKGKTIKDFSYSELRSKLREAFPDSKKYINAIRDKSHLWQLCIKHNLV